ncbi:hypothetical protein HNO88_004021 [Novosphingobium chloroacetimidivorans]|uniref:Uncharacterized protein n=1 Tax=Novosphingobium chloroacetimidivorans TaxID=1428314 RepID=A0A7W7NYZ4_9SPHN|nr:hypothetical protein [Novosphingobium chloroacetimidivorans]MBB4860677.1 hypothetical protein [Novosphingobium chloroacetimidivorans]
MNVAFLAMVPWCQIVLAPWECSEVEWSTRIVCPEWKMTKGVGTGDMWLELGERSAETDGYEHSWLTATLKATPTSCASPSSFGKACKISQKQSFRTRRRSLDCKRRGSRAKTIKRFCMCPLISRLRSWPGLRTKRPENGAPADQQAAAQAIAAKPELDKLLERVRAAGKRK